VTICIFLRPEQRIRDLAEGYAARLAEEVESSLVLGQSALAHITLVHLDGIDDKVDEIWSIAKSELDARYQVEGPFYLSVIPFPDGSEHNFVRIEVSRSAAFEQAQKTMLALGERLGAKVTNLAGPAWRPHVTLAVIDRLPEQMPQMKVVVDGSPWTAAPAIGTIGPFRHVDKLMYTLEDPVD
jgi:2'-5' RNA ligase